MGRGRKRKKFSEQYDSSKPLNAQSGAQVKFKEAWKALTEVAGENPKLLLKALITRTGNCRSLYSELKETDSDLENLVKRIKKEIDEVSKKSSPQERALRLRTIELRNSSHAR